LTQKGWGIRVNPSVKLLVSGAEEKIKENIRKVNPLFLKEGLKLETLI
jgi:hypothetical protein